MRGEFCYRVLVMGGLVTAYFGNGKGPKNHGVISATVATRVHFPIISARNADHAMEKARALFDVAEFPEPPELLHRYGSHQDDVSDSGYRHVNLVARGFAA